MGACISGSMHAHIPPVKGVRFKLVYGVVSLEEHGRLKHGRDRGS
jgi:hypothetical protein